jgi:sulfur-carrier protein
MIEVRLFADLHSARNPAAGSAAKTHLEVEARPGLRVRDIVEQESVVRDAIHMILINGIPGTLDSPLADGDRVALFPPLGGG